MKGKYFQSNSENQNKSQVDNNINNYSKSDIYKINNKDLDLNNINYSNKEKKKGKKKISFSKCCNFLSTKICQSNKHSKKFYMKGWRDYLEREGNEAIDKAFKILTKLFVNDDEAILGLESIRLNPNLVNENKLRNDLEFYIPQLCTFLLFGEMKDIEEFFVFLCKACNLSFFFAHRVHWFLSAMIDASQEKKDSIIKIIKMINTLFRSENEDNKNRLNKFYISNSESFINYIKINNLFFLYDNKNLQNSKIHLLEKVNEKKLNGYQLDIYNKYNKSKDIIFEYSEKEYQNVIFKDKNISTLDKNNKKDNNNESTNNNNDIENELSKLKNKLNANDFLISISNFEVNNQNYSYEDEEDDNIIYENENENDNIKEEEVKNNNQSPIKKKILDINFSSYYSSLNFIEHLCDISNELSKYSNDFQKIYLYGKLLEINKKLPCNAYLPFLKESTRNYLICHIPLDQIKIFRTKTRCPIMLTFEMVRIDEINRANKDEEMFSPLETSYPINYNSNNNNISNQKINSSYENNFYYNSDYDLSKPLMISSRSGEINKSFKKNKTHVNKKWYKSTNINLKLFPFSKKGKFDHLNDLEDKDIEEENKYNDYVSKFLRSPVKLNNSLDKIEKSKTLFEILKTSNLEKENEMLNSTISGYIKDKSDLKKKLIDEQNNEEKLDEEEENHNKSQKKLIKNNIRSSENENMNSSDKIEDEIRPISYPINKEDIKNIFGEPFSEKEKKLKKESLFGKLNSYKLFTCIIKTNEDLRLEQFATQLINEFYQIFKLENTGCWLNTYEIISTGKNSGLVEMVNNSLSLDQLKQKTNHISLKDFYINYYGNGNEESPLYKKAMYNFVSSLAGYSLVCYFLQIKDRHNGNILIDNEGHIIHIDFGFLLSNAPGKGLKFENAPFKLTNDMVECLGGIKGKYFMEFRKLLKKGFLAIHKHRAKIIILVEMMWCGHGKNLECFEMGQETIDALKQRLNPKNQKISKKNIVKLVDNLIGQSVDNWRTKWYDIFQYYVQGIFY